MLDVTKFNKGQLIEIYLGRQRGLDTSIYENPKFEDIQMKEIREGLERNVNVHIYAKPEFDEEQMWEIRKGLEDGIDVSAYAKSEYYYTQMREIRWGLEDGLDVNWYTDCRFNEEQMREIRLGLTNNIDVSLYSHPKYTSYEMRKIRIKMKHGLNLNEPLKEQIKYGYKIFNKDMTCRGVQFVENEIFEERYKPIICKRGFHFCLNLLNCFDYYNISNCVVHRVEILGDIDSGSSYEKYCTNKIKILERVYDSGHIEDYL